jgi:hypothetical protein
LDANTGRREEAKRSKRAKTLMGLREKGRSESREEGGEGGKGKGITAV